MSSSYEYSSSSKGVAGELFEQVDANRDGVIDREEFTNFVSGVGTGRVSGTLGSSSYESGSYSSGIGVEDSGFSGRHQTALYRSTYGIDASALNTAASYTADSNSSWSRYNAEVRGVGLYVDPNPQIIRREMPGGVETYRQNIQVRYLQPPPVPPPGPLIIKEVRPPQPPPLPPLRIKQQEPPMPALPPLILRERPPHPPEPIAAKTVIKTLAALPVPPRSVIIERYPAAPAPPRDIIIERWLPYGPTPERKTIVERAEDIRGYDEPHNIIIQYETVEVRVVRQFQHLGVAEENPKAYLARYGSQVLDTDTLIREARVAGVVEDISIPVGITSGYSSLTHSSDASYGTGSVTTTYSSRNFKRSSEGIGGNLVRTGFQSSFGDDDDSGFRSGNYETSSYSTRRGIGSDVVSTGFSNIDEKI